VEEATQGAATDGFGGIVLPLAPVGRGDASFPRWSVLHHEQRARTDSVPATSISFTRVEYVHTVPEPGDSQSGKIFVTLQELLHLGHQISWPGESGSQGWDRRSIA
jgi:hypothetical protein